MAGCKRHLRDLCHIPRAYDEAPRVWLVSYPVDYLCYLIDMPAIRRRPGSPLVSIDGTQITALVRPLIPDSYAVVVEILGIRASLEEPQQFVDYGTQVEFLGREEREAFGQIKPRLGAKYTQRPGTGTVALLDPVVEDVLEEVQVLFHRMLLGKIGD